MQPTDTPPTRPVLFWDTAPDEDIKKPNPTRKPDSGRTSRGLKVTTQPPSNYLLFAEDSAFSRPSSKFEKRVSTSQNEPDSDLACDLEIEAAFSGLSLSNHANIKKDQQSEPAPVASGKRVILKARTKYSYKNRSGPPIPERLHSYPGTSVQQVKPRVTLSTSFSIPATTLYGSSSPDRETSPETGPVNDSRQETPATMAAPSESLGFHSLPYDFAPVEQPLAKYQKTGETDRDSTNSLRDLRNSMESNDST